MSDFYVLPPRPAGDFDPREVIAACLENGHHQLLIDRDALPPEFFDLSTRVAGDLVQRLTQYEIRMAAVVPDPTVHSRAFQDFAREAGTGRWFRFFPTREEAVAWLTE